MTLGEAKSEVLKLLDETKPKADLTGKLDRFFDMGQKEVALYYPIWREKTYAAEDEKTLPQDCCKPRYVIVDGIAHPYTKYSQLPDAFTLRYEAYPADIPDNAPDETEFDLPDEAVLAVILFRRGADAEHGIRPAVFPELLRAVSGQAFKPFRHDRWTNCGCNGWLQCLNRQICRARRLPRCPR